MSPRLRDSVLGSLSIGTALSISQMQRRATSLQGRVIAGCSIVKRLESENYCGSRHEPENFSVQTVTEKVRPSWDRMESG